MNYETNEIMNEIVSALKEAGYSPREQINAYLALGDPKYITKHNGARDKIQNLEKSAVTEYYERELLQ